MLLWLINDDDDNCHNSPVMPISPPSADRRELNGDSRQVIDHRRMNVLSQSRCF